MRPLFNALSKKILLLIAVCAGTSDYRAQVPTFNYTVNADSMFTYQPLTSKTVLHSDSAAWPQSKKIGIGFSFPFLGRGFDSLSVEKNNYISFDQDRSFSILAFPGFSCKKDSLNKYSTVAYNLNGSAPGRILKIEFEKTGSTDYTHEFLNYQVWLHEDGKIEFVIGNHSFPVADSTNYNDTLNTLQVGLINANMDTPVRGVFLSGSPTLPSPQPVDDTHPEISFIRSMPRAGTKYSFIPN